MELHNLSVTVLNAYWNDLMRDFEENEDEMSLTMLVHVESELKRREQLCLNAK